MSQDHDVEVEQEANWKTAKAEIGKKLCGMDWREAIDRLDLDDQRILDHDVETVAASNPLAAIIDWEFDLTFRSHPSPNQFSA
ncbi:MAG TPA: hypothetical protein VF037_07160, partial [Gemmatimonadales bacterium]